MRGFTLAATAAIGIGLSATSFADTGLSPMMDPDQQVQCARDKQGLEGRLQCNDAPKVCLSPPNVELDSEGNQIDKPLERARECAVDEPFDRAAMEAKGFTMMPG